MSSGHWHLLVVLLLQYLDFIHIWGVSWITHGCLVGVVYSMFMGFLLTSQSKVCKFSFYMYHYSFYNCPRDYTKLLK